jgi:hypothetical protein
VEVLPRERLLERRQCAGPHRIGSRWRWPFVVPDVAIIPIAVEHFRDFREMGSPMRFAVILALACWVGAAAAQVCSGCGCKGGPGYRGPNGRCVGWAGIGRTCGSPPTLRCAAEGVNPGADAAAMPGVKVIETRKPAGAK